MKKQNVLTGLILLAVGIYFLLRTFHLPYLSTFNSWPSFFIIIGFAFFAYSYFSKEHDSIFVGVLLLGLGIHFHFKDHVSWWPSGLPMYGLIIGLAFLARYFKGRKTGLIPGIIFTGLSVLDFFYERVQTFTYKITSFIGNLWPLVLIALGLSLLLSKKKK
ncbi:putative RDD family membrane protein YckC [Pullulanibacillus pueri]|uniref:DUF5668 domain-containing protein n=1 Tax=Pullulanibacillus pueri TaxID=1437324 RepID=A0A8J3A2R8_9BACL|nr:DUF5668 domain-containing protein [Pullulanibacillus pueri]MBM7684239.1 putative RDD family membrane protein YckC [Pullulanibacillus pueri]GGH89076.1 hypothetical protein GCM10007096_42850 [Pullulanibacillus pueri]